MAFILRKDDKDRSGILRNAHAFIDRLPVNQSWFIDIKKYKKERSNPQCRYLNGVAYKNIGDTLGYERDDISEYLCGQYFGWKEKNLPGGRVTKIPVRTTTTNEDGEREVLKTDEFFEYVEFVQRFGAEYGIFIPDPEPEQFRTMK